MFKCIICDDWYDNYDESECSEICVECWEVIQDQQELQDQLDRGLTEHLY